MTIPTLTAVHAGVGQLPLILGPSLGTASPLWDDVIDLLAPHFSILSWDLPGHGLSRPAAAPFTLRDLADGVLRLANEQGFEHFGYAGVSLGGAVGVELALRHPDRISALSSICSLPKFGEPSAWRERATLVRTQSTAALVVASAGRWFGPKFIETNQHVSSALLHVLSDMDDESYALCCEVLAEYDERGQLKEIVAPFLALSGQFDTVATPNAMAAFAAAVTNGRAVEIPDAGHLAPAEQPVLVARELINFFTKGREQ